ncbi:MAG TPA: nuclear transport factor 2 family protein [Candidatus Limnocylindrales bacterium]|nr:nuclear transport factor 2 family protein [Candidatus Limnocylindrales bacterium]
MTRDDVQGWLDRYIAAWRTYDRAAIGALFSADAEYRYHPWDAPLVGRDEIVRSWIEPEGPNSARDEPGTYEASYEPFAVDGHGAVAIGWTTYLGAGGEVERTYDNCFLLRFADDGSCRSFTELFMLRPADAG